jgi:hypothetical protein
MRYYRILLLFSLLFLNGCKDKKIEKDLTRTEMVARTWVCDEAVADIASGKQRIYKKGESGNILELKDSFVTFTKEGKYSGIDFYATPQTGVWSFKKNETIAVLDSWDYDFEIVSLSSKNLDFNTKVDFEDKTYDIFVKMVPR